MKICNCNNCNKNYEDTNPSNNSIDFADNTPVDGILIKLYEVEGDLETGFWACPICLTDGHLVDNIKY